MAKIDKIYTLGAQGDDVKDLQTLLGVTPTGTYDENTANAVTQYQQNNNLTVDGVVGDETLGAILGTQAGATSTPNAAQPGTPPPAAQTQPQAQAKGLPYPAVDMSAFNMPGVSDATRSALGDLITNGYRPSPTVESALKELNDIIENEPAGFTSKWSDQIDAIMNQILGRKDFSYDFSADPTYQMYRDKYQQAGRMAMMDTMGQAAQLTGGYGSSYASTAGNQAYQQHLTNLNDVIPQLRQQAMNEYQMQGQKLSDAYGMMSGERAAEQSAWQSAYNQWADSRNFQQGMYNTERQMDYDQYGNRLDYFQNLAQQEQSAYNTDRQYAYQTAMNMLTQGLMPTAQMLEAAGLSKKDAEALMKKNKRGGSSSSKSGSGGAYTAPAPVAAPASTGFWDNVIQSAQETAKTINAVKSAVPGSSASAPAKTNPAKAAVDAMNEYLRKHLNK